MFYLKRTKTLIFSVSSDIVCQLFTRIIKKIINTDNFSTKFSMVNSKNSFEFCYASAYRMSVCVQSISNHTYCQIQSNNAMTAPPQLLTHKIEFRFRLNGTSKLISLITKILSTFFEHNFVIDLIKSIAIHTKSVAIPIFHPIFFFYFLCK